MDETKKAELIRIASGIAAALGPEWSRREEDTESDWRAYLDGPDDMHLFLSNTWAGQGKLHISGVFPQNTYHENVKINVNLMRSPEAIAKDITRRLLPGYRAELAKGLKQEQEQKEHDAGKQRTIRELSALLGAQEHHCHYAGIASIEVTGPDQLKVKLDNLSFATFREMYQKFQGIFRSPKNA